MNNIKAKTILISQKDLHSTTSGVPRIVHQQIKYFSDSGSTVYAAAERIDKLAVESSGGIPVKTFRWPISGFYRRLNYIKRIQKLQKKLKPNLVIGHGDIIDQDICFIHNCVHLAHEKIHGTPMSSDHEVGKIHREILTQQRFKVLVCNSLMMKNDLIQRFSIPESKVEVLYPLFKADKFYPGSGERAKTRETFGFMEEDVVLGFITSGNFKKRNLSLLLEAVAELSKEGIFPKVLVAGKDKTSPYEEEAKRLHIENQIVFAPSIKEVENYYACSDIFTLPARIEEFGLSIMEAKACAKPVVTTDMTGASEIFEGESKGFVLHNPDAKMLANKLKPLIQSAQLREKIGKLNSEAAKSFGDRTIHNTFGKILEKHDLL